jgi:hypothetical protein
MSNLPGVIDTSRCFISDLTSFDLANLRSIDQTGSFVLEDFGVSDVDLLALPDQPPGFQPTVGHARQEFCDERGQHIYWLAELRQSVVWLIAGLAADQIEPFCRRWSAHRFYSPFQGWEHVTPEVADQICREKAFKTLCGFLSSFHPFCQRAVAEKRAIFLLRENHAA